MNQSTKALVNRLFKMDPDDRNRYIGALRTRLHLEEVVNALHHEEAELTRGVDELDNHFECPSHILDNTEQRPPAKRPPLVRDPHDDRGQIRRS